MSTRRRWALAAGVVAVAVAVLAAVGLTRHREQPHLSVEIGKRTVQVAAGTTVADAIRTFRLRPHAGRLLDVNGRVLRPAAFAGTILVDGRAASGPTSLQDGDRIAAVDGRDRTEQLERSIVRIRNGLVGDPQYTVARAPGEELIVRGAVSHELVATHFRTLGRARAERSVALTFDDGPSPAFTPLVLRTLKRLHVHATFFVIGYLAGAYPTLVEQEHRLGMAIGNHTYNHPEVPPFAQLPHVLIRDEIALAADVLTRLGVHSELFRPPAGSTSPEVERTASALGERTVLWSVDPSDWVAGTTARQIATRVLAAVRPGSIVILHDGGGDRAATVAALPRIVRGIRHRGLRLIALAPEGPRQ